MSKAADIGEYIKENPEWKGLPDLLVSPPSPEEILEQWPDTSTDMLERSWELLKPEYTRGAFYWMLRADGQSARWAATLALQKGPVLSTDSTFFEGSKRLYEQFGSQKHLDRYIKAAQAHGYTPSPTDTYFSNLARFPGDPEAFVSAAQGRGYIRKLCEKRGWACEGAVEVSAREAESDPLEKSKPLGEDIIRDRAMQMAAKDPNVKRMDRRELRQKIIDKHGPQKVK